MDDVDAIKAKIQDHLVASGNYEVISKQLRLRLYEAGWFDQVSEAATEILHERDLNSASFESLYNELRPKAGAMVPADVKEEVVGKIREYLEDAIQ